MALAGSGATPPKAGPGSAGILPARSRPPRHCREGRSRYAPPANDRNCRAPRIPAMPRNGAPALRRAPRVRGRLARTSPPRTMPPRRGATPPKAGPGSAGILPARSRTPRHCREGRSRCAPPANDRNCRAPRIPAMPRNGAPARTARSPGARASRPHVAAPRGARRGEAQPRRRRGPGPRASCPHVPARRDAAEESRGHRAAPRGVCARAPRVVY